MHIFVVPPRQHDVRKFVTEFEVTLRLAERFDFQGILLFDGENVPLRPWVLAQYLFEKTEKLTPLVALGPAYLSADAAARNISDLYRLYKRPLALNYVAGATTKTGSHANRYKALSEFAVDLQKKLDTRDLGSTVSSGAVNMKFVAGHSKEASEIASACGGSNVRMLPSNLGPGIVNKSALNFGIVTRPTTETAWAAAKSLFSERQSAKRVAAAVASRTDSKWKSDLLTEEPAATGYWRVPAQNLKADSPMFVGSYAEFAVLLTDCQDAAVSSLILDIDPCESEYEHVAKALQPIDGRQKI